jgi:NADP-dependent 3-hydroxy acid dehydrogenase YdfG
VITGRREDRLKALADELLPLVPVHYAALDVRDSEAVQKVVADLPAGFKQVKTLLNNAGLALSPNPAQSVALEDWHTMIDTNIKGLINVTHALLPTVIATGAGASIINIGSIAGDAAYPGGSVYCATKAAVKALSDGLRIDLVDTPLRVTNIKPGMVETNFTVVRYRGDKDAADAFYKGIRPLTGDDIAETVYYAASAPEHIQIAEVLVMPTYQATGTISYKKKDC